MKDKGNYLKIASIIEFIYILIMVVYNIFFNNNKEEVIANLFLIFISLILTIIVYKESKKVIDKISKSIIIFPIIWLFIDYIIPGILGFMFLSSIKKKEKLKLPEIKDEEKTKNTYIKAITLIIIFGFLMFVLPRLSIFNKIPTILVYILILLSVILVNYIEVINNFKMLLKNKKEYFKFIIKRYFIMLGVMIIIALPIVLINNGNTSNNQTAIIEMFKQKALLTLILTSFYAPLCEEVVFRLSISKLINNKTLFIIISGFLFGLMHVIDDFTSIKDFLYVFQYSALGICLAKAYADSKNIFVPITMHFIQNFLASLLVLLLF